MKRFHALSALQMNFGFTFFFFVWHTYKNIFNPSWLFSALSFLKCKTAMHVEHVSSRSYAPTSVDAERH